MPLPPPCLCPPLALPPPRAAGALAEGPKLLLLDELTTFLDVEDQFGVLKAVKNITSEKRDITAIWVTHRWAVGQEGLDAFLTTHFPAGARHVAFRGSRLSCTPSMGIG